MKICTKCDEEKLLSEFYKDSSKPSGYRRQCKVCTLGSQKNYRAGNKDKIKARNKAYYDKNKKSVLSKNAAWKSANPDYMDSWREANREHLREYQRTYQKDNYDYYLDKNAERRARIAAVQVEGSISRSEVFERDSGICYLCNEQVDPNNWHLDHVVPISKGGPHTYDNVRVTHPSCNLSKGSRHIT
jgi:hypothetical protein